jgi:5-methylcytosine-specific restriction protein A
MVTMLKPRITSAPSRIKSNGGRQPGSVGVRWAGRRLQAWRSRILSAEPLCRHCLAKGVLTAATEVDHEIPLGQGGTYDDANAQPLCTDCHKAKTKAEAQGGRSPGWPRVQGDAK